jgi:hypothetical protein
LLFFRIGTENNVKAIGKYQREESAIWCLAKFRDKVDTKYKAKKRNLPI